MRQLTLRTDRRTQFINITELVRDAAKALNVASGSLTVFVPHTTAGVTINENADPDVMADMEDILERVIPWHGKYRHGEGNSAAHAKASLMGSSVRVPILKGEVVLGTWQGVYFCEFDGPRSRQVWVM